MSPGQTALPKSSVLLHCFCTRTVVLERTFALTILLNYYEGMRKTQGSPERQYMLKDAHSCCNTGAMLLSPG